MHCLMEVSIKVAYALLLRLGSLAVLVTDAGLRRVKAITTSYVLLHCEQKLMDSRWSQPRYISIFPLVIITGRCIIAYDGAVVFGSS
jgi:hypothetical protein